MTKLELVNTIALQMGLDRVTIQKVLDLAMEDVREAVANGDVVSLRGFGTFGSKVRAAKMARNISKNVAIFAPEHKIPAFKASKEFRDQLNATTKAQ